MKLEQTELKLTYKALIKYITYLKALYEETKDLEIANEINAVNKLIKKVEGLE